MVIKDIGFGNTEEAYIEKRLSEKVNVIYSDDNNKGKTLLIQGMMYALGNTPIFPSGFDYLSYYFYTSIFINDNKYEFLRKRNTIIVKGQDFLKVCESVSELKYFIDKELFELPRIYKNSDKQIADVSLFYQLFFIGQDKRDTSNTINHGRYNKKDFIGVLESLNKTPLLNSYDIEETKEAIKSLKEEKRNIKDLMKLKKKNKKVASLSNSSSDFDEYKDKLKKIKTIKDSITSYKNIRTRETNRKLGLENLIRELNSLNREIKHGGVVCANCGSKQIIYVNKDLKFEVSNKTVRSQILQSINDGIKLKNEIIHEYTEYIKIEQAKLKNIMGSDPVELWEILLYSEDILNDEKHDSRLNEIEVELNELENAKKIEDSQNVELKEKNKKMLEKIIGDMNILYREIDPNGNVFFDEIFTKKDVTYSGSEEQEYYYSRVLAINEYFKHQFPIIIDSFRSGELSSNKEEKMLLKYSKLNKQVILTATLKLEEYNSDKYSKFDFIDSFDYSENQDSKILQPSYVDEFLELIKEFPIIID